jgi:hypothetical protein
MKSFILAALVATSALASTAQAGIMIDATQGPITVTVSGQ